MTMIALLAVMLSQTGRCHSSYSPLGAGNIHSPQADTENPGRRQTLLHLQCRYHSNLRDTVQAFRLSSRISWNSTSMRSSVRLWTSCADSEPHGAIQASIAPLIEFSLGGGCRRHFLCRLETQCTRPAAGSFFAFVTPF